MQAAATRSFPWRRGTRAVLTLLTALAVTFAGLAVPTAVPTASAATIDTNAWYVLVNRNSGKALDVFDRSTADGAGIDQWSRNNGAWQQWRFVSSGSGYYRLQSRNSGKVIDISGRSTADGANVVQWADNNGTNQQFSVQDVATGYVQLINRNSGKALEVWEWSTADGARVSQFTDTNAVNQQWQMIRVASVTYPNPGVVSGATSPVHDPEVVKKPDGTYLLAHTGDNIVLKTSTNRTAWSNAGVAFPNGMPWIHTYTNNRNDVWAPDITYANGRYYMYYSASLFQQNRSAIFLATSTTGAAGSWTNQGLVIASATSDNWNAIDPNLVIDQSGAWWLSFGSFWSGIKMIRIDSSTGLRSGTSFSSIASRPGVPDNPIEAPTIHYRNGYYYLFVSFDRCCQGASSTYRTMVGRSTSVNGPYVDRNGVAMTSGGGTEVLAGHGSFHGTGHQAVLADTDGDVLFYHYYDDAGAPRLGINLLAYDSENWPYVR
jgi:arabinan endo-1,5-alpha-L-arabinosidase